LDGTCSILEGESLALLEALKAMQLRGISQVIFEMDSKSSVDALHHLRGGYFKFSLLVSHINYLLLFNLNFSVKYIKRQINIVAYTSARTTIFSLVAVLLRHYLFVFLLYLLMK
jgi:ribonuclease HI